MTQAQQRNDMTTTTTMTTTYQRKLLALQRELRNGDVSEAWATVLVLLWDYEDLSPQVRQVLESTQHLLCRRALVVNGLPKRSRTSQRTLAENRAVCDAILGLFTMTIQNPRWQAQST